MKRLTIAEAKRIAKDSGHRLVRNVEWNEFIITGPYFPTGYHSDNLEDVIDTLLYMQRRTQSIKAAKESRGGSNPHSKYIAYVGDNTIDVGSNLDTAFRLAKEHSKRAGEAYLYDASRHKMIAHFTAGIRTQEGKQHEASRSVKYQHKGPMLSNPKRTLIYGQVNRIIATKKQKHICDAECKRHGHRYFHDFTSKPKMYGLPNGDLLITTR